MLDPIPYVTTVSEKGDTDAIFAHHGFHHLGLEFFEYLQAVQLVAMGYQ